jgi:hypothetical protein
VNKSLLVALSALVCNVLLVNNANAVWELESENKPSGVSAYATTFWLEGTGPISLDDLVQVEDEIEEGSYWATLMVSCTKKKLLVGINLNMAGSANRDIVLDDPGYTYLRFDSSAQRKYKTYGSDLPSSLSFVSDARAITTFLMKSNSMSITLRDRISRDRVLLKFDVSGFSKAKTRFRYAGCKL